MTKGTMSRNLTTPLTIKAMPEEIKAWKTQAVQEDLSLSQWLRKIVRAHGVAKGSIDPVKPMPERGKNES